MKDIAIIGAGVIGTAIARELSRYNLDVVIIEKDNDISNGTTKANSAIVHAGYDAPADSLKGKLNVKGNAMFQQVCEELSVPFKRIGSLTLAYDEKDETTLRELYTNGLKLNVPHMKLLTREEVFEKESNVSKRVISGLYAPSVGITEPWALAIAYCENAMDNGVSLKLNFEVDAIEKLEEHFVIKSKDDEISARYVINAAGVYADDIYNMVTKSEFQISPRRGQYLLLDKEAENLVKHIIFTCPTAMGKGTLITPTVDGNIIVGPDSEDLDATEKDAVNTTTDRLNHVKSLAREICEDIPFRLNITTFAGLRAEPSGGDFIIEASDTVEGFVNVAGMKSPGLSSAPAIAEYVVEIMSGFVTLVDKVDFNPRRRKHIRFDKLSDKEKDNMIKENPQYGRIICRCEMISEGEIVDVIHRHAGGRTVNGIKRRVRPGAGRCQGGFCGPRVMEILSRELGVPMSSVLQENEGSVILTGKTKEGA